MTARQRLLLTIVVIGSIVTIAGWVTFYTVSRNQSNLHALPATAEPASTPAVVVSPTTPTAIPTGSSVVSPMDRINERVTKKRFGTLVSPTNSPVSPEKFSGYHTAWDFETFADETDKAVTVTAFCGGKLVSKRTADGYGGVVVQECQLGTQAVTIIYGHLKLSSVAVNVGDYLAPGATIGQLGEAISPDTDGERKHLHFGIHKGTTIDIKGYVSTQAALSAWIDPNTYL